MAQRAAQHALQDTARAPGRLCRLRALSACVYLLGAAALGTSSAATVDSRDWARLSSKAAAAKAVPVVVDVASTSMVELNYQQEKVASRTSAAFARIRAELGQEIWAESASESVGGQLTAYVTARGLQFLKASGNALSFREGAEWYAVSPLHRSGKSLAQLDAASQGAAGAQAVVTLNVEGLEYTVDRSGLVRYSAPEPSVASVPSLLEKLAQTVDAIPGGRAAADLRRLANSALASSAAFDPTVTLTLNKREVAAIASSKGIRDIRLASEGDVRPFAAPFNVIADAETHGYVDVIVTMRQSVPQGNLSASSTLAHWKSVEASMDAVRADLGGLRSLKNLPAVDSMVGRVSRDELKALAASRDMRLANVSGSGVVGQPALEVSNAFLNMPLVWNSSGPNGLVSGAGAKVVVMDTGVQSGDVPKLVERVI